MYLPISFKTHDIKMCHKEDLELNKTNENKSVVILLKIIDLIFTRHDNTEKSATAIWPVLVTHILIRNSIFASGFQKKIFENKPF